MVFLSIYSAGLLVHRLDRFSCVAFYQYHAELFSSRRMMSILHDRSDAAQRFGKYSNFHFPYKILCGFGLCIRGLWKSHRTCMHGNTLIWVSIILRSIEPKHNLK